ncbi:MAG: BREX-1 system adenine-specific DNA-methyltransferase PglX [Deltaproteobacteria bacterium]|jgi:type II restriction/modification system DNA methylase subunit YeeA|nr:BREX-1 system adenine-specific DNA-methyltransferase PglX [Deltaproteobacteria bacterium]
MNTAQIKAYAPRARNDFIKAVTQRAARFGIHGNNHIDPVEFKGDVAIINDQVFTRKGGELREKLVASVKQTGFEIFIRSNAYTWFNRFIAIRYMELHDFLDHGLRVLSNPTDSDIPEILEHATEVDLPGLDRKKIVDMRLAGDKDNDLYKMLVIAQCNALHKVMPFLFDPVDSEAELLLPDNLLHSNSPVKKLVDEIDESLWENVEIIGWIYQFYISEKKDEVIGKVVKSKDIPAATQLFTPNWIVKYMVQNTLGRMWMATYPTSFLKNKMEYYIEPAQQEPEVQKEIDTITPKALNPEDLTFLDPACGSGHILVEAYDILKKIYLERGYRTRDISRLILEKNLYGLDIDDRAAQLACFAVLMRARKDDRQLFTRDGLKLNIMSIMETKGFDKNKLLEAVSKKDGGKGVWVWIHELVELFEHSKTFGSLITIPDELAKKLDDIKSVIESDGMSSDDLFNYIAGEELESLRPIIMQTQVLAQQYDCVVTNPPYLGGRGMNINLKQFANEKYPDSKMDLFAMFLELSVFFAKKSGLIGLITPYVWMFLSTYESFRNKILSNTIISSLTQLEYNAFEPACVPVTTFTLKKLNNSLYQGSFIKLSDFKGHQNQSPKALEAIKNINCEWRFQASGKDFNKIPGHPIAYWLSDKVKDTFIKQKQFGDISDPRQGLATANNDRFLRFWYEIDFLKIGFSMSDCQDAMISGLKWFPYNKGGAYRKWYGNFEYVVNWFSDGEKLKNFNKAVIRNPEYYFKEGITWSDITSSDSSFRYLPNGFIFDSTGHAAFFPEKKNAMIALGLANTNFINTIVKILNPTLHFHIGYFKKLPFVDNIDSKIIGIVKEAIKIAKDDWNHYETAWDFNDFPFLSNDFKGLNLEKSCDNWKDHCRKQITRMQELEIENNILFNEAFNIQTEFSNDVNLDKITLRIANRVGNIKNLISYIIGCIMGRYSLDESGLIYANRNNENFDKSKYKTFPADDDGIIPIMDMDWFDDDASRRFVEFIKTAWPSETLNENLKFIADSLNPKTSEPSEETIRRYLSTTFFKDHMKTYKKRPIYWLFSSGKQKAFECLVYLHRYNDSTLSRMRSHYVTPLQGNMRARIEFLEHEKDEATTASNQKKIQKEIDILKKKQLELKVFDDELRHYADMKISIDLDDGVKVNYGKFGNLLSETKAITGKK